jgi:tetratricopeptide (TPR) repeat protein
MVGGPGLPTAGGPGLPSRSAGGLPSAAGPGLPSSASHAGLPVVGTAGLPITSGPGLPSPFSTGSGASSDMFPSPTGMGLPSGAGSEMSFGNEPGAFNVGSVDLQSVPPGAAGGVGGEVELGGSPFAGKGTPQKKRSATADYDEPKRSRGLKVVGIGMLVFGIAGGSMAFVDSIGPFGMHAIGDKLNADKYDAAVVELRKTTQATLDEDTLPAIATAVEQAKAANADRERHQDTKAYAAFLLNLRIIRFGPDGGSAAAAKAFLDGTDRTRQTVPALLALAAEDMLSNQLARARQHLDAVQQKEPEDVDALVLAGEIELISKEWAAAITAFSKAVNANKSARTLYGLARAQMAAGKLAEAEATAKGVLDASKNHVGARTLLATLAAKTRTREAESLKLLNEVTGDATIRAGAGSIELVDAYVALGNVQLQGSRFSQAQEAYAEALKLNPQSVPALIGSGELFYRSSRYSEAEARFESALRADPDNLDAKIGTAKTWLARERVKEAKDFLAKLQTAHPEDSRVFFWIARVSVQLGNRKDAEGYYEQAIEKAKGPEEGVPAYVSLAALLAQTARANEANNKLVEAAKKYPESAELARARGDVAVQTGKYEEALNQYEQALKKNENDLQTRFQVGVTLRRMRKFDEAIVVFDKVESMDKDFPNLALERGLYYEETGQSDEALKMYKKALDKAPNDVDLKLRIGSTQVAAGAGKQAEPILKEVIRERSNSPEANHYLGRAMLISKSNLNEAMRYLKRAVELDPNRAEYHLYVGWAANEAGQPEIASSSLAKALELDSSMGDAYWQRGILLQRQGRNADAIKDLLTALEKRPSRYEAYAALASAYGDQQNATKGEEAWRNAIKGNDKIADWHYQLGKVLDRKGDAKGSFAEMEKAVELGLTTEPKPGWLGYAHLALGRELKATDKDKAAGHFKEYLRLAPLDDAYRDEATQAIAQLK